jgi:hypothetical protein
VRNHHKDTASTTTAISLGRFPSSHNYSSNTQKRRGATAIVSPQQKQSLCMGLFDSFFSSSFLQNRQGDFVQLDKSSTATAFGPGPLLILYNVPTGIQVQEVLEMIHDGAPSAHAQGCTVVRLDDSEKNDDDDDIVWDLSLEQALNKLLVRGNVISSPEYESFEPSLQDSSSSSISTRRDTTTPSTPVLFFSGFRNDEMMNVYNILGQEIFQEMLTATSSVSPLPRPPPAACAMAVPKAMNKPLRQVLEEISGDHQDAIAMTRNDDGDRSMLQ